MIARPMDVMDPSFIKKLTIYTNQQHQDAENAQVHDAWVNAAQQWVVRNQRNQDMGLPVEAPLTLPVMTLYNDDGSTTTQPFPDLTLPVLASSAPKNPTPAGGNAFRPDGPPQDPAVLLAQLIYTDTQAIRKFLKI